MRSNIERQLSAIASQLLPAALAKWERNPTMRRYVLATHTATPLGDYFLHSAAFVFGNRLSPETALRFRDTVHDADAAEIVFNDALPVMLPVLSREDAAVFRAVGVACRWMVSTAYQYRATRR